MSDTSVLRERLIAEGLDPGAWSNGPGDRYGSHDHGYDKVIVVAAGSIRFGLPMGRSISRPVTGSSCRPDSPMTPSSVRVA
jgi:hypothetical protein